MTLLVEIPGRQPIQASFLLLDVNGTLSDRGELLDGIGGRLEALQGILEPRLLSADTFGTLASIAEQLTIQAELAASADEKLTLLRQLGGDRCIAVGNGTNDARMLAEAALGIAVLGPEGTSGAAIAAADVVCRSVLEALDLLAEPQALAATLRT